MFSVTGLVGSIISTPYILTGTLPQHSALSSPHSLVSYASYDLFPCSLSPFVLFGVLLATATVSETIASIVQKEDPATCALPALSVSPGTPRLMLPFILPLLLEVLRYLHRFRCSIYRGIFPPAIPCYVIYSTSSVTRPYVP